MYELSNNQKEQITHEFEKLTACINHVMEISNTSSQNTKDVRDFIVNAGIEIYKKL